MFSMFILGSNTLYAQQNQPNTLGSLWPLVEANYPGLQAKNAAVAVSQLEEQALKSSMLPQVKMQAQNSYGTFEGSSGAFFPQAGFFNVSGNQALSGSNVTANSFASATLEWEVLTFGRQQKEKEAAALKTSKTQSEQEAYLLNLKKILANRYISLLYHSAKLNWTAKNTQRLDDIRKITAGLSAAGLRPAADSLLASSSYMQALGEQDQWTGAKTASQIKVLELLQTDSLSAQPLVQRFIQPQPAQQHQELLMANHPVLQTLAKQEDYYATQAEVSKKAAMPSVKILGGYAFRGSGIQPNGTVSAAWHDGFGNTTNNVLAGIGLTWNLTNLHTNKIKAASHLKEAEASRFLQEEYAQAMQADISARQQQIRLQFAQLQKTDAALKQSQDAYAMYLARYKSGLIALSELLQISSLLEQAENKHIEASRHYWMLQAEEATLTANFDYLFNNL